VLYRVGRSFFEDRPGLLAGPVGALAGRVPRWLRHGAEYRRIRRLLRQSQWWTREQLDAYQLERLRETVSHAYERSPYYRERFDEAGVRPEDLRRPEDIRHFPTVGREDVRENLERIVPEEFQRKPLMKLVTGGTTGSGLVIPVEERFRNRERGFVWHLWEGVGYTPRQRCVILRNRKCPPEINDGIWYMDKSSNAMIFSAQRLGPNTIGQYLAAIEKHRPEVLIAYPSLAHLLTTYARDAGWSEKVFKLVLLASETLYEFQRRELEARLQAPVRILYGHVEGCALFGYCDKSSDYHVQPEYGYVEFLRSDGSDATPGEVGEIVATNFENRALPLIRYRTGDLAEPSDRMCPCGRQYRLVERIQGREGDYIQTPSGQAHSPTVIEFAMDQTLLEGHEGFADLQFVQERIDEIVVKVVPGKRFTPEGLDRLCELLDEQLAHECRIEREVVREIPRTARQKKLLVMSKLAPAPR
jgi:phenylacetate-CoA ligase